MHYYIYNYTYNCRFCETPVFDHSQITSFSTHFLMDCKTCANRNIELYDNKLYSVYYKFVIKNQNSDPQPYNMIINLNPILMISHVIDQKVSNNTINFIRNNSSLALYEKILNMNNHPTIPSSYTWQPIMELPTELLNKSLPQIIDKINSLKAFF